MIKESFRPAMMILALCCTLLTLEAQEEAIVIASGEWPPFHSEKLPEEGFYSHIISESFAAVGIETAFQYYPWPRAYYLVRIGRHHASGGWMKTPEREREVLFSDPFAEGCTYFFHRKDLEFSWNDKKDLEGYRIGTTLGYRQTDLMETWKESGLEINLETAAKDELNIRKLLAGRIDLYPSNRLAMQTLLRRNFTEEEAESLTFNDIPLFCDSHRMIFSAENAESRSYLDLFNRGLKIIRRNGVYDRIIANFIDGYYD